jgi:hypothetical protein
VTEPQHPSPRRPKPTLAQRTVAFTFIGAFALTMATVVFTGLRVERPGARAKAEPTTVTLTLGEPRTVNLVFDSRVPLADVELTVDVPAGVELAEHPGERRVVWHAPLAPGSNVLPLTLVARGGSGGTLGARLRHGGDQKTFAVELAVAAP